MGFNATHVLFSPSQHCTTMPQATVARKRLVKWTEVQQFAKDSGRSLSHVYRVFVGERVSKALEAEIESYFGVPLAEIELAGRRSAA